MLLRKQWLVPRSKGYLNSVGFTLCQNLMVDPVSINYHGQNLLIFHNDTLCYSLVNASLIYANLTKILNTSRFNDKILSYDFLVTVEH